ncbi:hypothetical protein WAK64_17410 [Bacillus spongiae]|uniref:DUF4367 domain-containing protein n=1 Tax=Bacillus spongiae TaxID=2683610 RepID=A0ABU8HHH0_9BACI
MYNKKIAIVMMVLILFLSACSATEEENIEDAKQKVELSFEEPTKKRNEKAEGLSFYTPFRMKVVEETQNNLILEKGSNTYIMFYNRNEDEESTLLYELSKEGQSDFLIEEVYEGKERFGYFLVSEESHENVQVIVGIGGSKITTITSMSDLPKTAELMMKMVSSIEFKK